MYWMTQQYKEGFQAFKDGRSRSSNPYDAGSEDFSFWDIGFRIAEDEPKDGDT